MQPVLNGFFTLRGEIIHVSILLLLIINLLLLDKLFNIFLELPNLTPQLFKIQKIEIHLLSNFRFNVIFSLQLLPVFSR